MEKRIPPPPLPNIPSIVLGVAYSILGAAVIYQAYREAEIINNLEQNVSHSTGREYTEDSVMFLNVFSPVLLAYGCLYDGFWPNVTAQVLNLVISVITITLQANAIYDIWDFLEKYEKEFDKIENALRMRQSDPYYKPLQDLENDFKFTNTILLGIGIFLSFLIILLMSSLLM